MAKYQQRIINKDREQRDEYLKTWKLTELKVGRSRQNERRNQRSSRRNGKKERTFLSIQNAVHQNSHPIKWKIIWERCTSKLK